jgi:MFS-type transporter involved in bile tolerance (Atg22 family)
VTISIGLLLLSGLVIGMFLMAPQVLIQPLANLPLLGTVRVISLFLMTAGVAWSLININSLPMVVDMVELARVGTYTGLYYLFSTLAAIAGPNVNGLIIQVSGNNYNSIMLMAAVFMILALILMWGVRRGEAVVES